MLNRRSILLTKERNIIKRYTKREIVIGRLNSFLLKFLKQIIKDKGIKTANQIAVLNHSACKFIKRERNRNPKASLKLKVNAMITGKSEIRMIGRYLSPII